MKWLWAIAVLLLFAGCGRTRMVLGNEPDARQSNKIGSLEVSEVPVQIKGEVIEKGKRWLIVKDDTGKAKVETESAGFEVDEVPLHGTVTIAGVCQPKRVIEATGLRTE